MTSPDRPPDARHAYACYLRDIRRHALIGADEELRLCRRVRLGDTGARQRMIECNLRLVIRIAVNYRRADMAMDDLVAEGNLGLMHAIDKFDPEMGHRFSTYAVCWIRQYIERGIMNQSRTVRIPVHVGKRLNQCLKASRELSQLRYREPRHEEIAARTGHDVNVVRELLPWRDKPLSLDVPVDGKTWQEQLVDEQGRNPEERLTSSDLQQAMTRWLASLRPREQEILSLRFGLRDGVEHTLDHIAGEIGVTRERVRQIQIEALWRLRQWLLEEGLDADVLADV